MKKLMRYIVDLIFPPRCAVCDEVIPIGSEVCDKCYEKLSTGMDDAKLCIRCGKTLNSCICCNITSVTAITSAFEYCAETAPLIERLKSDADSNAAALLAILMANRFSKSSFGNINFDCITYVPSGDDRIGAKGFDHARRLAEQLSALVDIPCLAPPVLQTSQYRTQHELDRIERVSNARIGYKLSSDKSIGKVVLLVDDIVTTGATLDRCAELMIACGTREVYCITAATTFIRNG